MAKATINPIVEKLRGSVGDMTFRHYKRGAVISAKPDMSRVVPSRAQLAQRERFRRAAAYGRRAMEDPEARAAYMHAAETRGTSVYGIMIADFFHPPSVRSIDLLRYSGLPGQRIGVHATDDFEVIAVSVTLSAGGAPIEAGPAAEHNPGSGFWVYTARTAVPAGTRVEVCACASDRPGSTATLSAEKTV